jgi:hypothetical protein
MLMASNLKNINEKEIRFPELAQYQSLHEGEKNVDWVMVS